MAALHHAGFANIPTSRHPDDGLTLTDAYIAAAVRCAPPDNKPTPQEVANCLPHLRAEIDALNASLKPLDSFVLPGGTAASAHLHLARTIVRRAERLTTQLAGEQPVNRCAIHYLNRLSDHLFVLARYLNDGGAGDVLWVPGANR